VNPYRGCFHGCAYCYARPTHEWLGFGAGTDFERRIVVKTNAPELLARAFARPRWRGETVAFSGVTDCYQPLEASYGLTRRCLEVALAARNPVGVITKGALVERDADLLAQLARGPGARVFLSIPFADDEDSRKIEPWAAAPSRRFAALERLASAGVPAGVGIAPAIPGLNDHQIPAILQRAKAAGAQRAFLILLRLPGSVGPVFEARLREAFPARADKVLHAIEELRGGRRNDPRFGSRMRGSGPRWDAIETLFRVTCRRLGLAC
jgi:DNA repair photolyase